MISRIVGIRVVLQFVSNNSVQPLFSTKFLGARTLKFTVYWDVTLHNLVPKSWTIPLFLFSTLKMEDSWLHTYQATWHQSLENRPLYLYTLALLFRLSETKQPVQNCISCYLFICLFFYLPTLSIKFSCLLHKSV